MNMKDFKILFSNKSNNMSIFINNSIQHSLNQFQSNKNFASLLKLHIELTYTYLFISKTNDSIYMYIYIIIYIKYIPTQIIHVEINKYFLYRQKNNFYYLKTFLSIGLSVFLQYGV